MDQALKKKLINIVGPKNVSDSEEDLLCYSYDGTGREYMPSAVIFPGSVEEVSDIMAVASAGAIPVVPRGAGSGMTGGSLPVQGGLVMAMTRLNKIVEIDRQNQTATVEPGVITGDLQKEIKQFGLYYPPDPASLKFCTIGGNAAECAGGPSAVKYGVTRDYVRGLQVVLADGKIINTGVKTAKGVVGYDLTRLFVGSEGTLGIITKLNLRLIALPEAKNTFLVLVDSMTRATELVSDILAAYLPCTMEYMDKTALAIVSDKIPFSLPVATEAFLLLEVDGSVQSVAIESEEIASFLKGRPGILDVKMAKNQSEVDLLWTARRAISPASYKLRPHKINEDVVVPRTLIPELVKFVEKLARKLDIIIFTFGHAGDGNIHVNIMVDKDNQVEADKGETAKRELFNKVLALGGTLSGEHGVGITKAPYLSLEIDDATIEVMKGVKTLFDPDNIMNPGKIFP